MIQPKGQSKDVYMYSEEKLHVNLDDKTTNKHMTNLKSTGWYNTSTGTEKRNSEFLRAHQF